MTRRFEITGEARRKLLCVAIRARCYRRRATLFFVWCGSVNYKTNAVTGNCQMYINHRLYLVVK